MDAAQFSSINFRAIVQLYRPRNVWARNNRRDNEVLPGKSAEVCGFINIHIVFTSRFHSIVTSISTLSLTLALASQKSQISWTTVAGGSTLGTSRIYTGTSSSLTFTRGVETGASCTCIRQRLQQVSKATPQRSDPPAGACLIPTHVGADDFGFHVPNEYSLYAIVSNPSHNVSLGDATTRKEAHK